VEEVDGRASLSLILVDVGNGLRLGPLSGSKDDCLTPPANGAAQFSIIDWTTRSALMLPEARRTTLPFVGSQCFLLGNSDSNVISPLQSQDSCPKSNHPLSSAHVYHY
jgi:hypothetical protein